MSQYKQPTYRIVKIIRRSGENSYYEVHQLKYFLGIIPYWKWRCFTLSNNTIEQAEIDAAKIIESDKVKWGREIIRKELVKTL